VEGVLTPIEGKDLAHTLALSKTFTRKRVATKSTKGSKRGSPFLSLLCFLWLLSFF
jgi:hypothetical protein